MLLSGICWWGKLLEISDVVDYRFLDKSATQGWSSQITYIVKSTKKQKGKPPKMDLPLLKNDITTF